MRGTLAELSEITRGCNDPSPKVVLPDSVDDHARGQRIRSICDCVGEILAAASPSERFPVLRGQNREEASRGQNSWIVAITANGDMDVFDLVQVFDDLQKRILLRKR